MPCSLLCDMIYFKMPLLRFAFLFFSSLILSLSSVKATHIKAGDIYAQRTSSTALTYRFTLVLYTDATVSADQPDATLDFGDLSNSGPINRSVSQYIGSDVNKNIYYFDHTYRGIGFYKVGFRGENRNAGVLNMSNSVFTAFYVELGLSIDPALGLNTSPILSVPPIDLGTVGEIYTHNPGAYDSDGDSLSYKLVNCQSAKGVYVLNYKTPGDPVFGGNATTTGGPAFFNLNAITGDLVWNAPSSYGTDPRYYNIAIMVEEWRLGVRIGYVIRDMQIIIRETINRPPVLDLPDDTCVVAGANLIETIRASDPDGNSLFLEAYSALFTLSVSPAAPFVVSNNNTVSPVGTLQWQTNCAHIREQPYQVVYKVTDSSPNPPSLSDLRTRLIYVKAPKPQNLIPTPLSSSIQLNWDAYPCPQATKIKIYRKECGVANLNPGPCDDGIPASSGYVYIGEVNGNVTTFIDDNKGAGLSKGVVYCYAIIATYPLPGNGISFPSNEVCTQLKLDVPIVGSVSVLNNSLTTGQIEIRWFKPVESLMPLPFEYEVWRASSDDPSSFALVTTLTAPPTPVDTFFTDTGLNTEQKQYFYKVRLVGSGSNGFSPHQSTIIFNAAPKNNAAVLSWNVTTVSFLDTVEVYRSINGSAYTLLTILKNRKKIDSYTDNTVQNCDTVCYYILVKGNCCDPRLRGILYSLSPKRCTIPLDDRAPKAPSLLVNSCSSQPGLSSNILTWNSVTDKKCNTLKGYKIYYALHAGEELNYLTFVTDTSFTHGPVDSSLAGCYEVTAVNYNNVEGARSARVCVDNCVYYKLPNLITRNKDGLNDVFKAYPIPLGVKTVRLSIYNKWGAQVFGNEGASTLSWDTRDASGKEVTEGVYYYEVEINYFRRLNPDDERGFLKGWIHILGTE